MESQKSTPEHKNPHSAVLGPHIPFHSLHIVCIHVQPARCQVPHRIKIPSEIRCQALHKDVGPQGFQRLDRASKVVCPTVWHVVAVNRGQHNVANAPVCNCTRLVWSRRRFQQKHSPVSSAYRTVFSGSFLSAGGGVRDVLTAQNRQPRVHVSPSSMMVAVPMPPFQHSPKLGH